MPGVEKRETVIDTAYQTEDDLLKKYDGIFKQLREEAREDIHAADIISKSAQRLVKQIENNT